MGQHGLLMIAFKQYNDYSGNCVGMHDMLKCVQELASRAEFP
jgi:hypothetical protein